MFDNIKAAVSQLELIEKAKLENGFYPACRDARKLLQDIKVEAQSVRNILTAKVKFHKDAKKAAKAETANQ